MSDTTNIKNKYRPHKFGPLVCDSDTCGGTCSACNLPVCEVCGLYEGGLTTECPGEKAHEKSDDIYNGKIDYRFGEWIKGCTVHMDCYVDRCYDARSNANLVNQHFANELGDHGLPVNLFDNSKEIRLSKNERLAFATFEGREYHRIRFLTESQYYVCLCKDQQEQDDD